MGNKLRKKNVAKRYQLSERSVDRWSADGRLPPPTFFGRVPLWDESELDACDQKHAARSRSEQTSA
jgi:predicted DNA-binding transcriptional regulator AlpA